MAQRKALALRCRQWEHVGETGSSGSLSGSGGVGSSTVLEAKRAALPCLRNLASFVSKQGRHVDAEVVLVRVHANEPTNDVSVESAASTDCVLLEVTRSTSCVLNRVRRVDKERRVRHTLHNTQIMSLSVSNPPFTCIIRAHANICTHPSYVGFCFHPTTLTVVADIVAKMLAFARPSHFGLRGLSTVHFDALLQAVFNIFNRMPRIERLPRVDTKIRTCVKN